MNLCQKSDKPEVTEKVESFKIRGGAVLMWWAQSAPLVETGLTDLPKSGVIAPPPPPAPHDSNSPEVTEKAESLTRSKIDFL